MSKSFEFEPRWFVVLIFTLAGIFLGVVGFSIWMFNGNSVFGLQKIHPSKSNYTFINPLLAVDISERKDFFEDRGLNNKTSKIIDAGLASGNLVQGAVYFKDVEAGRWFGINSDVKFSPGLILKMPLMMAYFKLAEGDGGYLTQELRYTGDTSGTGAVVPVVSGHVYPVLDLIKSMIIDNDDASAEILFDNIDLTALNDVYSDIGINLKEDKLNEDYISLKQASLAYRLLYNATYLNREYSELALSILHQTPLTDGMASVLPNDIKIAHRFRTRTLGPSGGNVIESNSCGIVYYPEHPYVLCVLAMSKNSDVDNFFGQISRLVYNDMKSRYEK